MTKLVAFSYTDEQWKLIEGKIGKHVDGLRSSIEGKANLYVWCSTSSSPISRSRSARQARAAWLKTIRESAESFQSNVAASHETFVGFGMFSEVDTYVDDLTHQLDFLISRLKRHEQPTGNATLINRDRFWLDLVELWIGMGGKPTGERTAGFIYEATDPVIGWLPRGTPERRRDLSRLSIVRWLERHRRAPKRQQ